MITNCVARAVGTPLPFLARSAGLTQATLAERSATTQSVVARIEVGHHLSLANLGRAPLGCDVRWTIVELEAV